MRVNAIGLFAGIAFGWILSWARLTDPTVLRDMLLLKDPHVFLIMGSAVAVAAAGCALLRALGERSLITNDTIEWTSAPVERRHVIGSVVFATGWSIAGTCPGPVAAMIAQGQLAGVAVGTGILVGVAVQPLLVRASKTERAASCASAAGL